MSIERCEKHSRHYDTDLVEECPLCLEQAVEKQLTVFMCPPILNHKCDSNGPLVEIPNGGSVSCSVCGSLAIDNMMEML